MDSKKEPDDVESRSRAGHRSELDAQEESGPFQRYHARVRGAICDQEFGAFAALTGDRDRFAWVRDLERRLTCEDETNSKESRQQQNGETKRASAEKSGGLIRLVPAGPDASGKDLEKALHYKEKGNAAFAKGDWNSSLNLYNKSYLFTPQDEGSEHLSIVLANRSACLYRTARYRECLEDCSRAEAAGYPARMRYKLSERKARCHLARGEKTEALQAFRRTLQLLDDSQLPEDKRHKLQTDVQIMMKVLERPTADGQQKSKNSNSSNQQQQQLAKRDPTIDKQHRPARRSTSYPAASDAVIIRDTPETGRYAVASRPISVGECVLSESAHAHSLLAEYSPVRCQNCFGRCVNPLACTACSRVVFCSERCRRQATTTTATIQQESERDKESKDDKNNDKDDDDSDGGVTSGGYHSVECRILQSLWSSGVSLTCQLALRMIAQRPPGYFLARRQELEDVGNCDSSEIAAAAASPPYDGSDYATVHRLVTHTERRSAEDLFHRSLVASHLTRCLERGGYFEGWSSSRNNNPNNDKNNSDVNELQECVSYCGGLVLRNLQLAQFNAHEVSELDLTVSGGGGNGGRSVLLGGAIYPTLALFNHSCDPALVRYFDGTRVIARCVRPIAEGEQIPENYGPIYTREPKESRRQQLSQQYWFECMCKPCVEDWPLLKDMPEGVLRFRCQSGKDCGNVIMVAIDTEEFMVKCCKCQHFTNILKGLKSLQDTDELFKQAGRLLSNNYNEDALKKYTLILSLLHETLAPPFKDYNLCQQGLRSCMLRFGNKIEN